MSSLTLTGVLFLTGLPHIMTMKERTTDMPEDSPLTIEREPAIPSSSIKSWGWRDGTLVVEFMNGALYAYTGVPEDIWLGIRIAPSAGKAHYDQIRCGGYSCEQLRSPA